MPYVDWSGREQEDPEMDNMRRREPDQCDCPQSWWDTDPRSHRAECVYLTAYRRHNGCTNCGSTSHTFCNR